MALVKESRSVGCYRGTEQLQSGCLGEKDSKHPMTRDNVTDDGHYFTKYEQKRNSVYTAVYLTPNFSQKDTSITQQS